ncbi:hypothetical protein HYE68_011173 [Fusarium pseudograminearum]|nr:hypothetical protein HYE68_011173 [Fusarium pseudograminearum]
MQGPARKTPRPSESSDRQYVDQETSPEVPLNIDGHAFNIELPRMRQAGALIDIESLPSLDYAIYLTNTVKFHIAQTYHIFEESHFMRGLLSLYNDGPPPLTSDNRMWYIQYFLVMAMGKGLLTRGMSKAGSPGSEYFLRAMELFPDASGLYEDPILSIEVCCGLALYLQAVDHRNSAYVYLGLGLRIALSQGLHRDIVGEFSDDAEVDRYRNAWWTLYILDRKFSSLMGAPSSVQDRDISVPVPGQPAGSRKSNALDMHIKLSRLIAKVLNKLFLPFDLDHAFSAGFVLALISTVQPFSDAMCDSCFDATTNILDTLIAGGNLPACFRRQELERLHDMLHLIKQRERIPPHPNADQIPGFDAHRGEQGISPTQLLTVTNMLDSQPSFDLDFETVNSWLWEFAGAGDAPS